MAKDLLTPSQRVRLEALAQAVVMTAHLKDSAATIRVADAFYHWITKPVDDAG